jgi:hypothetical protein
MYYESNEFVTHLHSHNISHLSQCYPHSTAWSLLSEFWNRTMHMFIIASMRATYPAHLTDLVIFRDYIYSECIQLLFACMALTDWCLYWTWIVFTVFINWIVIQGVYKRMVRFQKLTRNLFLNLHGQNVHRQQRQLSKFLRINHNPSMFNTVWFHPAVLKLIMCSFSV